MGLCLTSNAYLTLRSCLKYPNGLSSSSLTHQMGLIKVPLQRYCELPAYSTNINIFSNLEAMQVITLAKQTFNLLPSGSPEIYLSMFSKSFFKSQGSTWLIISLLLLLMNLHKRVVYLYKKPFYTKVTHSSEDLHRHVDI